MFIQTTVFYVIFPLRGKNFPLRGKNQVQQPDWLQF